MAYRTVDSLAALSESTATMMQSIADLTDNEARGASLLEGWTRGHVLTHVARNAEAMVNLVESARTRTHIPMYSSRAERAAAIEAGADRPAEELRADVARTAELLSARLSELDDGDWEAPLRYGADDREAAAWQIPMLRRCEVEIHHVDLDIGYTPAHWPADFVQPMLDSVAGDLDARVDSPSLTLMSSDEHSWTLRGGGQVVCGPAPALLGWLIGRTDGAALTTEVHLPQLGAWR